MTNDKARMLIAGNWKMNGNKASLAEVEAVNAFTLGEKTRSIDVALCLPATLIALAAEKAKDGGLKIGAEDCHINPSGAHTGDISAPMLVDAGASYIIVGHSERRTDHKESDVMVAQKAEAALAAGATPIICVGETEAERKAGKALEVVAHQIENSIPDAVRGQDFVIAYEPVWAIGTGLTPTSEDIAEIHNAIRAQLVERYGAQGQATPILYGGSLKPGNADEILAIDNVDGGLIGGASLKAADFNAIIFSALKLA